MEKEEATLTSAGVLRAALAAAVPSLQRRRVAGGA